MSWVRGARRCFWDTGHSGPRPLRPWAARFVPGSAETLIAHGIDPVRAKQTRASQRTGWPPACSAASPRALPRNLNELQSNQPSARASVGGQQPNGGLRYRRACRGWKTAGRSLDPLTIDHEKLNGTSWEKNKWE